jgi:phosphoadenosine phosphosulfate reductase
MFEPRTEPYYLAYSGGKDSDVILTLAKLAGIKYEAVHNLTTVDAPETIYHVRKQADVRIDKAHDAEGNHITMESLIVKKKMPPTRIVRYCCSELKERGGERRKVITGVRKYESKKRNESSGLVKLIGKPKTTQRSATEAGIEYRVNKQGGLIMDVDNDEAREWLEDCYRSHKTMINPIVDWTDDDVWEFLRHYNVEVNPLYECGYERIGCIGCPLANINTRLLEFARYPKYKERYIQAFDRMLIARREEDLPTEWLSGEEVFAWWMGEDINQLSFFDKE